MLTAGYSSAGNYLSELGAVDAPFATIIRFFGFLPVALSVIVLVIVLWQRLPRHKLVQSGLFCLLGITIGYLGAVVFPCDSGCPSTGSASQLIHNLAGLVEYMGGVLGLFLIYFGLKSTTSGHLPRLALTAACITTSGVALMFNPELEHLRGATQRLADYTMFAWLMVSVFMSANLETDTKMSRAS